MRDEKAGPLIELSPERRSTLISTALSGQIDAWSGEA